MNPSIQFRKSIAVSLIALLLACFAISPMAEAVSPPPDGGYPGFNTAEGDNALFSLTTGFSNTAIGNSALFSNTTGHENTAIGWLALNSNTTSNFNTATGDSALTSNTTGGGNTATGAAALYHNTTGISNTATGYAALATNTTGTDNTAIGYGALSGSIGTITGSENTATGKEALTNDSTGFDNTANGVDALFGNTTGNDNTATGFQALLGNVTGNDNTATGAATLFQNTTGSDNTANGIEALHANTTGNFNTATGAATLFSNTTGSWNTANGVGALISNTTGVSNVAIGGFAGFNLTTGGNNIDIGNSGVAAEANTIRIGIQGTQTTTYIAGISGTIVAGVPVFISSGGQLGVSATSSARFKQEIKPMDRASEAILALRPVTFRYKKNLDPKGVPQFGLVAEEVQKVNPDLIVRDENGEIYTVRYDAVNAMLLNEFLKEHKAFVEEQHKVQQLEANAAQQQTQIDALTAGLQKVSAQLELNKPASRTVVNNQ